ncbi:hypothetical protein BJF86_09830 [Serinicoccus sp. CNJ-927]|uniref:glycosyltransferase n=1 Tax=Serinicoccus sp. CNJ-927 TaxID=1904970 RepID=UPI00095BE218|nr:glycosyltransferase [Serinicoccus sp. CNJ-927]OLT38917.1 hypothetical protein BJF86_09830 [Serinicoccus sp. CNJ-927]
MSPQGPRLPSVEGRAPRVALLVYNDAHADSRVIKTAESLRAAGAQVRIFAVARAGYPEGPGVVGDAIEVCRAREFALARQAPWLLDLARRVTGRQPPEPVPEPPASLPKAPGTPAPTDHAPDDHAPDASAPATGERHTPAAPGAAPSEPPQPPLPEPLFDLWLRTWRTASLGLYWWDAARDAVDFDPDVVHANDGNTLAPSWWIAQRTGARLVYDAHELWRHRNVRQDRPVAPHVEALIESTVLRQAAGVITVSPSIVAWLQETYDLPETPTLVRNVPRPAVGGAPGREQGRLRALAGLGPEQQVIAYGGRITTSRGIEETLEAMTHLGEQVHLVLLGYGEVGYLAALRRRITDLGLEARVHFVGAVAPPEVSTALADADVSVVYVRPICLSYRYSLPNKLFESIHAGIPVVAADLPDTAELVRELGVGEIFSAQSPADLAATIEQVLADPTPYAAAARAAAHGLTWTAEEERLLGLYARVLRG